MSETKFDYIGTVKKVLKNNELYAECFDSEHSSTIETGTVKVRNIRMSFKITVNEDGWLLTTCPMAGKVPTRILEEFMAEMLVQMGRFTSLKFYLDGNGIFKASYEAPLPNTYDLIESEVLSSMSLLDAAYVNCLPKLMLMYWSTVAEDGEIC